MKKIYLAALTLAMTACVSNDDLNPVDNYGYIDVNVSNDPVMVTRADGNPNWIITATKNGSNYTEYTFKSGSNHVPAGTYVITAKSHADVAAANTTNDWGEAYYEGKSNSVTISAGQSETATIDCKKAKNSRIKANFNLNTENNTLKFSDYKLTLDYEDGGRRLDIDQNNVGTAEAYFSAGKVKFEFSYKFNNQEKNPIQSDITCEAGKEHIIRISANENGIISLTINYDDQFDDGGDATLYFDAATGEKVETSSQGE